MRKQIAVVIMLLVVLGTLLSMAILPYKADAANKLDVKVELGFKGNYKIGHSAPVTMNINNTYKDIQGEVEIRVPSAPGKYISYVKPISMQKNSERAVTINIPVTDQRLKCKIYIYNKKEVVYKGEVTLNQVSNNVTKFIGILSDDYDSLTYINRVPAPQGVAFLTKSISLDEKNFPDDIFALRAFDVIVINNFDTSKFDTAQYELLKQWVKSGGTLLIGTGSSYNKTLGVFKDDFLQGETRGVGTISTSRIYSLATNGDNTNSVEVEALDFYLRDSAVSLQDSGNRLLQRVNRGSGVVALAAFDLGQAPFIGWNNNTAFAEKLLELSNPNMVSFDYSDVYHRKQNISYMLRDILNNFSEIASARMPNFYLILLLYIVIVGPVAYIILKKLDKREFMWLTVPATAVAFAFIVYLSGSGTRLNKSTINLVSFLNISESDEITASVYAGVMNAKKMKLKVESKESSRMIPISDNYYHDPNYSTLSGEMEAKIYMTDTAAIEFINTSILQAKMMELQQGEINIGRLETDITILGNVLSGKITNNTNMDFDDCFIITNDGYYRIESLNVGESKVIGAKQVIASVNIYDLIHNIFQSSGGGYYNPSNSQSRKELMDRNQQSLMMRMFYEDSNINIDGVKLIAFSKSQIHNPILVNGSEATKNERAMIIKDIKLNFVTGNKVDYPIGYVKPNVVQSNTSKYDPYSNTFYGDDTVEIHYNVDREVAVEQISILSRYNQHSPRSSFSLFLYNYENSSYEEISDRLNSAGVNNPISLSGAEVSKYVSSANVISLKFEIKDGECSVPKLGVSGKVK